jgi:hypothetical protein
VEARDRKFIIQSPGCTILAPVAAWQLLPGSGAVSALGHFGTKTRPQKLSQNRVEISDATETKSGQCSKPPVVEVRAWVSLGLGRTRRRGGGRAGPAGGEGDRRSVTWGRDAGMLGLGRWSKARGSLAGRCSRWPE